ncbi:hypothetical protein [Flavobacterium sp.]|jgi:hypothetical protein|uniref:hypothetical protein n=1 Tax=Flavobacterium sp. TaxID=239 RepID=UPI0037C0E550
MDISQKDFILLFIGAAISFIISWLFYGLPYKSIASYFDNENNTAYFESQNGFKLKRYEKRNINEPYKTRISSKEFKKIKQDLVRRSIDF